MIRRASLEDLPQLLHLGEVSCSEIEKIPFDHEYAEQYVRRVLTDPDSLPLVIEHQQDLVGYLLGCLTRSPYSPRIQAIESHWYVLPGYRQSLDSLRLLVGLEGWAKAMGADEVVVSSGNNPKLDKVLKKMGYQDYMKINRKVL